jgi:hypothetical protein
MTKSLALAFDPDAVTVKLEYDKEWLPVLSNGAVVSAPLTSITVIAKYWPDCVAVIEVRADEFGT